MFTVVSICHLFLNTITLESLEMSSWNFYASMIWIKARMILKMAAFQCSAMRGRWFNICECSSLVVLLFCRLWRTLNSSKFLGKGLSVRWSCVVRRAQVICMPSRSWRNQSSLPRLISIIFFALCESSSTAVIMLVMITDNRGDVFMTCCSAAMTMIANCLSFVVCQSLLSSFYLEDQYIISHVFAICIVWSQIFVTFNAGWSCPYSHREQGSSEKPSSISYGKLLTVQLKSLLSLLLLNCIDCR